MLKAFLTDEAGAESEAPVAVGKLSKRQKQLLVLLDKGLSIHDIADNLQISEHTVNSRSQASHLARTQGLL